MIYIKDMDMPVDCLACRISCKHESYLVTGRPKDCPLEEAKTGDLISRADAIEAVTDIQDGSGQRYYLAVSLVDKIRSLPSAEANLTCKTCADRALCIMSAPDGKWKACKDYRPSAEAVQGEWIEKGGELVCSVCGNSVSFSRTPKGWVLGRFCQTCGAKMKGGDSE